MQIALVNWYMVYSDRIIFDQKSAESQKIQEIMCAGKLVEMTQSDDKVTRTKPHAKNLNKINQ